MEFSLPSRLTWLIHWQLVEAINQTSEVDTLVPGMCAFLLGICYEFNREAGEITRYAQIERSPGTMKGVIKPVFAGEQFTPSLGVWALTTSLGR